MHNRLRADDQRTSEEPFFPICSATPTHPVRSTTTWLSDGHLGGSPPRHFPRLAVIRTGRHRGIAVIILGLILQMLSFACGVFSAWAKDDQAVSEIERPAYQILRFDEDWSVLKGVDRTRTGDLWDLIKYVPILPDQGVWLSVGGQVRERFEYFNDYLFGSPGGKQKSDGYLLSRFRLSVDLHITPYFRAFAEGKSSLSTNRDLLGGTSNNYVDTVDLQNGFGEVRIPIIDQLSVTLRGGREELLFGAQRLVGPSDWGGNVRRTFDGGQAIVKFYDWTVTPFWAELVVVDKYRFNESSADHKLYGAYATGPFHFLPFNLDVYWLDANNAGVTFNGTKGRERRHTLGGRAWGKIGNTGLDFEVEGAGQFGSVGDEGIGAWMLTTVLGYSFPVENLSPRVYIEFDYASGDSRPGGHVGTFNQLYPTGHSFLGYIDFIGRQNIITPNGGLSVSPIRGLTVSLQQYFFWRASEHDALYNKSGGVIRPGNTTTARYVGAETDLYVTYNFDRHILTYAGYSHFFSGDFIRKTGSSKDSDYIYAAIQYTF